MSKKHFLKFALTVCITVCATFMFTVCSGAIDVAVPTPNANQQVFPVKLKANMLLQLFQVLLPKYTQTRPIVGIVFL